MTVKIKRLNNNFQSIINDVIEIEKNAFGPGGLNRWGFPPFIYHGLVYVIQVDRETVGVIEFMRDFNEVDEAYLYGLAISEEYQGQGLGNKLLDYSLKELKKQKINKVELTVDPDNERAIKLYQKFGFEKIAYRKAEYGSGEDRTIMKLSL